MADERINQFMGHVLQLAEREGIELDDSQVEELYLASRERGFTDTATETAFDQLVDRDYEDDDTDAGVYEEDEDDDLFEDDDDLEPEEETDNQTDPRLVRDVHVSLEQLQRQADRPLTNAETERAVRGALERVEVGGDQPQVHDAIINSAKPRSEMTESDWREWQEQRFNELHAERNPEPEDRVLDFHKDQDEWMTRKIRGESFEVVEDTTDDDDAWREQQQADMASGFDTAA